MLMWNLYQRYKRLLNQLVENIVNNLPPKYRQNNKISEKVRLDIATTFANCLENVEHQDFQDDYLGFESLRRLNLELNKYKVSVKLNDYEWRHIIGE